MISQERIIALFGPKQKVKKFKTLGEARSYASNVRGVRIGFGAGDVGVAKTDPNYNKYKMKVRK